MLKCCILKMTCSSQRVIRSYNLDRERIDLRHLTKQDHTKTAADLNTMDIAVLQEQYNWIKEKQKLETRVVLFRKASNNEEICGKSLVNMVPVSQEVNDQASEVRMPAQVMQFNFTSDLDVEKTLWRTHLGVHRMKCTYRGIKVTNGREMGMSEPLRELTSANMHSLEIIGLCEKLPAESFTLGAEDEKPCQDLDLSGQHQKLQAAHASRKFFAPSIFTKQLSETVQQPSSGSSCSQYYPFPQRKAIKKSEAAKRLGMYLPFNSNEDSSS